MKEREALSFTVFQVLAKAFGLLYVVLLLRVTEPTNLAVFVRFSLLTGLGVLLVEFGAAGAYLRRITVEGSRSAWPIPRLAPMAVLFAVGTAMAAWPSTPVRLVGLAFGSVALMTANAIIESGMLALRRPVAAASANVTFNMVIVGVTVGTALVRGPRLSGASICVIYFLGALSACLVHLYLIRPALVASFRRATPARSDLGERTSAAGAQQLVVFGSSRVDQIALSLSAPALTIGLYGAAVRLVDLGFAVPNLLIVGAQPRMVRALGGPAPPLALRRLFHRAFVVSGVCGVALHVVVLTMGRVVLTPRFAAGEQAVLVLGSTLVGYSFAALMLSMVRAQNRPFGAFGAVTTLLLAQSFLVAGLMVGFEGRVSLATLGVLRVVIDAVGYGAAVSMASHVVHASVVRTTAVYAAIAVAAVPLVLTLGAVGGVVANLAVLASALYGLSRVQDTAAPPVLSPRAVQ